MKELRPIEEFFKRRNWQPFPFQREAWKAFLKGESGLLHIPTGSGKTYAAIMGPFAKFMAHPRKGLKAIYITPLRALARDLELALREPIEQEGWPIKIEARTGDTNFKAKKKQMLNPPDLLLITPESLSVLISQTDAEDNLKNIEVVILDEWHELMSSKRGSLLELSLSYLRTLNPELQIWALSASIGNIEQAAAAAVGPSGEARIISGGSDRKLDLDCLLPQKIDSFPWSGHLGFVMRELLVKNLDPEVSTLIFTNTRSQAEMWFERLADLVPEMESQMAIHHGSLSREEREAVEAGVKDGSLKWVVCTSSLDLGVDFQPVERVVQIGSPKMVARMMQRAGRSAHRPGGKSKLLFVPTNSWEIFELEAVKKSLKEKHIEPRPPIHKPIDVLLQHMMTLACGPGLKMDEFVLSLQGTYSFSSITSDEINWCRNFLTRGGEVLQQYPQFHKLFYDEEVGVYRMNPRMALQHRMSIGTIVSEQSVSVVYANRSRLGSVQENFISKMKKGDVFQFAGKRLEFVMLKDMTAYVRSSKQTPNMVPSWNGGRFPISETLSEALRKVLNEKHPQMDKVLRPLIEAQKSLSVLPSENLFLIEQWNSKDGEHLYAYPFEGRQVHEGLAQLWALRFARRSPATFSISVNDYGFEITGPKGYPFRELFDDDFFASDSIADEMALSLEIGQLTQRKFREIAQIAGLIFVGYPGSQKSGKQKQISSSLLYSVFKKHEPGNLLIQQSFREVLSDVLEEERMVHALRRMLKSELQWIFLEHPSPLSFPLLVDRLGASAISNESLEMKVARLRKSWEEKSA